MLETIVEQLTEHGEISAVQTRTLLMCSVEELSAAADVVGETADLVAEGALEQAAARLGDCTETAERVQGYWLNLDAVPGGTHFEVVVRSAEFLAAYYDLDGVSDDKLNAWATSENWRERLVCAWFVRDKNSDRSRALREALAADNFQDDDGIYLVREGAGYYPVD